MRAIVVTEFGEPDVLKIQNVADPRPAAGEVRVRVRAVGVNFADTERRRLVYDPPPLPWTPGSEAAGVVDDVGVGVDPSLRGRRVAFYSSRTSGAYAELVTVPAEELMFFPRELPFETMAAVPQQGLTAYGMVHLFARVRASQTVLIHAAAGGVGQIAVQLLLRAGARVFGTVSTDEKAEVVRRLGAEPLLYGDDLAARVRALTSGRGVDVVFDSVGRATQRASLDALAPYGHLVFLGDASGPPEPIRVEDLYDRTVSVGAFTLRQSDGPEAWAEARRALAQAVCSGELVLNVSRTLPLERAPDAHRALETRVSVGKIVLVPDV